MLGALLGGITNRAGERSFEAEQRKYNEDLFTRKTRAGLLSDYLEKNHDNLLPEEQAAITTDLESTLKMPKGALHSLIQGGRAIHQMIQPLAAPPTGTRGGGLTATPSAEPPVHAIEAPPSVKFDQLPQPGDTTSPSIMTPPTPHIAELPSRTPGEIKAEREQNIHDVAMGRQMGRIGAAEIPEEYKRAARVSTITGGKINPLTYEVGMANAEAKKDALASQQGAIRATRFVVRGGQTMPVYRTQQGEVVQDPQTGQHVPYMQQEGDEIYEKAAPLGTVAGSKDTYSFDRKKGTVAPLGIGTPPAKVAAPQSQLTTITTPEGPQLAEYTPSRGGKGNIRVVQQGAVKGTVPGIAPSTQKEFGGLGMVSQTLHQLQGELPAISTGPLWGRLRTVQLSALGGYGASPEEVKVATHINMLMRSAFDTAGANFTEPEMNIFRRIYPQPNDTLETAVTKIGESLKYVDQQMTIKKGLLSPMQRSQTQFPSTAAPGSESKVINGVTYRKVPGGWQKVKQ